MPTIQVTMELPSDELLKAVEQLSLPDLEQFVQLYFRSFQHRIRHKEMPKSLLPQTWKADGVKKGQQTGSARDAQDGLEFREASRRFRQIAERGG